MRYRQALALAEEMGMRPLVAHCHLGLGKLYRRTASAQQAQRAPHHRHDHVPRDGHAVLSGAGGGRDGGPALMRCPHCRQENPAQANLPGVCHPTGPAVHDCGTPAARIRQVLPRVRASCRHVPHRTRARAAQARFASPETYTPRHLAERILTSKAALEGERKQVTVLFADLKGSMELLADRDPEEARKLLDPVLERMMDAVHRYEGTVNQVMGDGIMALFGAPLAHEDHAVRACYAALRMQESVKQYAEKVRRATRSRSRSGSG